MKVKLVFWLTIGFFTLLFGRTFYNSELSNLEESFYSNNDSFLHSIQKIKESVFYVEDKTEIALNQIIFEMKDFQKLDSKKLKNLDSLFLNIPKDSFNLSVYLNEQALFNFFKEHKTLQLNRINRIDADLFNEIERLKEKLKESLIQNPDNELARHNYLVLSKFYKENNLTFQTAKKLGDLVEKQLHEDLIKDSLSISKMVSNKSIEANKEKIEKIKSESQRKKCLSRMEDTLQSFLVENNTKTGKKRSVDSLRYHENFDLLFLNELKKSKSSNEIIEDFYTKKYPNLYQKSYSGSINEIKKDTNIHNRLSKILCEYLPEECQNDKENKPNQEKENNPDQKEKGNKSSENKDSESPENNDSQKDLENKRKEMQDAMKKYDENQKQEKENKSSQPQEQSPNQKDNENNSSTKSKKSPSNTNPAEKEILKKMEEQNEAYQKKNLENMPYNMDDDKPSW